MTCSNCGHEATAGSKFCPNCGAPLSAGASEPPANETPAERRERERREDFERAWSGSFAFPPPTDPSATTEEEVVEEKDEQADSGGFANRPATWEVERQQLRGGADDEWSMSDLGPAKPRRRRTWLWVVLGIVAVIVLACCIFGWWLTTDTGTEWFEGIATQAAEEIERATEQSATPAP